MFKPVENLPLLVCHHWDWVHLGGVESLVGAEEAGHLLPHHLLDALHHESLAEGDGDGADGVHQRAEHGPDVGELEADRGVVEGEVDQGDDEVAVLAAAGDRVKLHDHGELGLGHADREGLLPLAKHIVIIYLRSTLSAPDL